MFSDSKNRSGRNNRGRTLFIIGPFFVVWHCFLYCNCFAQSNYESSIRDICSNSHGLVLTDVASCVIEENVDWSFF